jgi:hypothetical protein
MGMQSNHRQNGFDILRRKTISMKLINNKEIHPKSAYHFSTIIPTKIANFAIDRKQN